MILIKKYGLKIFNRLKDKTPKDAISVERPSTYANPWSHLKGAGLHKTKNVKESFDKFRGYTKLNSGVRSSAKRSLKGKNLICSCETEICHATIIMELANDEVK